ncbi:hypothetical protein [Acuticoccus kandeliae]|uniref:hypothetical protein n=1 Tax=Acuticoccus kandeliae TaxID=2073160 RepID=UPI000D3EB757|nr:hypothetical protein [Acuticoccus kandeliae]
MSTIYLHIGMPKTGSTAIQNFFHRQRARAKTAGLMYSSVAGVNHGRFLDSQYSYARPNVAQRLARLGASHMLAEREESRAAFIAEMQGAVDEGLDGLLSAENLSEMLAKELVALRDSLPMFDRFVVLGFARPPHAWNRSMVQQSLKDGVGFESHVQTPRVPVYSRRFGQHLAVFGDNVRLKIFHRSKLVEGCILQTLLTMMDGDRSALASARAPRVNESMSLTSAKLLVLLNEGQARRSFAKLPGRIADELGRGFSGAFFEEAFASEKPFTRYPQKFLSRILAIPGPKFQVPLEVEEAAAERVETEVGWISDLLGEDIRQFDDRQSGERMRLKEYATFSDAEVDAIVATIERINAK